MRSVTLDQCQLFSIGESARPKGAGPGEALVRVLSLGICGTDLHAFEGTQPFFSYPRIVGQNSPWRFWPPATASKGLRRGTCARSNPT
jgi:threonine dehydrogenase-like Zn-dependent dehydrogenase